MPGMYVPRRESALEGRSAAETGFERKHFEDIDKDDEAAEFLRRESNVARIEEAAKVYTEQAMQVMAMQDSDFVDRETLERVVVVQRKRFYGCLSLPFTFAFFLMFSFAASLHEDITNVYFIESGLRMALAGGSDRIESIEDTWRWLNTTFWPTVFQRRDDLQREHSDRRLWNRVLMYNQLQGPVLMEQQRSTAEPCGEGVTSDMTCYGALTESAEEYGRGVDFALRRVAADGHNITEEERLDYYSSAFGVPGGRRLRAMRPEHQQSLLPKGRTPYMAFFHGNTHYELHREHLDYLRQQGWLDAQTKTLSIKALLLNSEIGRPRLESFSLTLAFSRAGGVHSKLELNTIFLQMWYGGLSQVVDLVWVLMLAGVTGLEIRNLVCARRDGVLRQTLTKVWTLLQWLIVVLGWCCVLGYARQGMLLADLLGKYEEAVRDQEADVPAERNTGGAELFTAAEVLTTFNSQAFRLLISEYHLILMLRFFMAFRAQPRLAVVVNTLEASLKDIFHFLVIVIPTFMAYAISGCFVFGRRMEEFSTFEAAVGFCFKMLMENEYTWPDLAEEHFWTAALWTWSFMILLTMLMLNMVLAIVMDAYGMQRKVAGKSDTVWKTVYDLGERLWNCRRWVSYAELGVGVRGMGRRVSRQDLLIAFPGMCEAQLSGLLQACRCQAEVEVANTMEVKHTMKMALAVKMVMDKVTDNIGELREGTYGPSSGGEGEPKGGWLPELSRELAAQNHGMLAVQWRLQQLRWQWQALVALHGQGATFDLGAEGLANDLLATSSSELQGCT